jgi:hypothetical protein
VRLKVGVLFDSVANEAHLIGLDQNKNEQRVTFVLIEKNTNSRDDDDSNDYDPFEQINAYWSTLPNEQQGDIFNSMSKIKDHLESILDEHDLSLVLMDDIAELVELHDPAKLADWVYFRSGITIPTDLADEFVDGMIGNKTKTILRDDYKKILALSVILRPIYMVWGEYIARIKRSAGTNWKEYEAYQLLGKTPLYNSGAMVRLRDYVIDSLPADRKKLASAIIAGISSEDIPKWILALLIVRKISSMDIRGIDPKKAFGKVIFKFVCNRLKGIDTNFKGAIKDKRAPTDNGNDESNLSGLENVKIKMKVTDGDIAIIESPIHKPYKLAEALAPGIPKELVTASLTSARALIGQTLEPCQEKIAQMVMSIRIPTHSSEHFDVSTLVEFLAVAQAILWHRGHYELAALITAINTNRRRSFDQPTVLLDDSRARIPKSMLEEFDKFYPYRRKTSGKKLDLQKNHAIQAIDSLEKQFKANGWLLTIPDEWLSTVTNNKNSRYYSLSYEFKINLARFALEMVEIQRDQALASRTQQL